MSKMPETNEKPLYVIVTKRRGKWVWSSMLYDDPKEAQKVVDAWAGLRLEEKVFIIPAGTLRPCTS